MLTIGDTSVHKCECLAVAEGAVVEDVKLVAATVLEFVRCSLMEVIAKRARLT